MVAPSSQVRMCSERCCGPPTRRPGRPAGCHWPPARGRRARLGRSGGGGGRGQSGDAEQRGRQNGERSPAEPGSWGAQVHLCLLTGGGTQGSIHGASPSGGGHRVQVVSPLVALDAGAGAARTARGEDEPQALAGPRSMTGSEWSPAPASGASAAAAADQPGATAGWSKPLVSASTTPREPAGMSAARRRVPGRHGSRHSAGTLSPSVGWAGRALRGLSAEVRQEGVQFALLLCRWHRGVVVVDAEGLEHLVHLGVDGGPAGVVQRLERVLVGIPQVTQ